MCASAIEELLGGPEIIGHEIRNEMDMYEIAQSGLTKEALTQLIKNAGFTVKSMAAVLNLTERTLQRKQRDDLLDRVTSEQVLQVADVVSRGIEAFGSAESFSRWLSLENVALRNKRPIDLLSSRYGAQMVFDELGRIEYGIIV